MTLSLSVIAMLVLVGLVLLLLEILVIPGTGVAGIVGFALIGVAIWQAFTHHGAVAGVVTVAVTVVLSVALIYWALKSKTWKRISLNNSISGKVNVVDEQAVKVGDKGVTVGRLAPMGKAEISGNYYEVKTQGDFLDQNTPVEVIKIEFNTIYVKPIKP
jgi:membrane-bound ClpP family serine protease